MGQKHGWFAVTYPSGDKYTGDFRSESAGAARPVHAGLSRGPCASQSPRTRARRCDSHPLMRV
jgi:hypothetical protein